jgi:hypothetical protein
MTAVFQIRNAPDAPHRPLKSRAERGATYHRNHRIILSVMHARRLTCTEKAKPHQVGGGYRRMAFYLALALVPDALPNRIAPLPSEPR